MFSMIFLCFFLRFLTLLLGCSFLEPAGRGVAGGLFWAPRSADGSGRSKVGRALKSAFAWPEVLYLEVFNHKPKQPRNQTNF